MEKDKNMQQEVNNTENEKNKSKDNKKNTIIIILLLLLLLLLTFFSTSFLKSKDNIEKEIIVEKGNVSIVMDEDMTDEEIKKQELMNRDVYFAGLEKTDFVHGDLIPLKNLPENLDFVMKFEIYNEDTNEMIFDTDFIYSGKVLYFDPYTVLKKGEYNLVIKQIPYTVEGDPLTSAANSVTIKLN